MDVKNRARKENALARELGREFAKWQNQLEDAIPRDPREYWVSPDMWAEYSEAIAAPLFSNLQRVNLDQVLTLLDDIKFASVDWGIANTNAADWASQYSFELVKGITDRDAVFLQKQISQYFKKSGMTLQQAKQNIEGFTNALGKKYGSVRAGLIARTEVTRAAVEGEKQTVNLLAQDGIVLEPYWLTKNDEIVRKCPVCFPRHNQPILDGFYPPGHPGCRCSVRHRIPKPVPL